MRKCIKVQNCSKDKTSSKVINSIKTSKSLLMIDCLISLFVGRMGGADNGQITNLKFSMFVPILDHNCLYTYVKMAN